MAWLSEIYGCTGLLLGHISREGLIGNNVKLSMWIWVCGYSREKSPGFPYFFPLVVIGYNIDQLESQKSALWSILRSFSVYILPSDMSLLRTQVNKVKEVFGRYDLIWYNRISALYPEDPSQNSWNHSEGYSLEAYLLSTILGLTAQLLAVNVDIKIHNQASCFPLITWHWTFLNPYLDLFNQNQTAH